MFAVMSYSPYYGNGYGGSAGPSTNPGYGGNTSAPQLIANSPFAANQRYYRPGSAPITPEGYQAGSGYKLTPGGGRQRDLTVLSPPGTQPAGTWTNAPNGYPTSTYRPPAPPTQLTPPSPGAQDYWNKYPQYPQSCGCPPSPSKPVADFNNWLQTLAPTSWNSCKTYQPGDQVIYDGNVFQAPNQGGAHCGVQPNTDCSKWLYHGTVVNNYNYYVGNLPKN